MRTVLTCTGDFETTAIQRLLAATATALGGEAPPVPEPPDERAPAGTWTVRSRSTVLETSIRMGDGDPGAGFPWIQELRLTAPGGSASVRVESLTLHTVALEIAVEHADARMLDRVESVLAGVLGPDHVKRPPPPAPPQLPPISDIGVMVISMGRDLPRLEAWLDAAGDAGWQDKVLVRAAEVGNEAAVAHVLGLGRCSDAARTQAAERAEAKGHGAVLDAFGTAVPDPAAVVELAAGEDVAALQALLDRGADVDAEVALPPGSSRSGQPRWKLARRDGLTPLLAALHNRRLANVEALLRAGADPNRLTRSFRRPLDVARALGQHDAMKVLEAAGAQPVDPDALELDGLLFHRREDRAEARFPQAGPDERARAGAWAVKLGRLDWIARLEVDVGPAFLDACREGHATGLRALAPSVGPEILAAGVDEAIEADRGDALAVLHELGADPLEPAHLRRALELGAADAVRTLARRGTEPVDLPEPATRHLARALAALDPEVRIANGDARRAELIEQHGDFRRDRWRIGWIRGDAPLEATRIGGPIARVAGETDPRCACGALLSNAVQLHLDALPVEGSGWIQVWVCDDPAHIDVRPPGWLAGSYPRTRIVRQIPAGAVLERGTGPETPTWRLKSAHSPRPDWPKAIQDLPRIDDAPDRRILDVADHGQGDKLGGHPSLTTRSPACATCSARMVLVLQLGNDIVPWRPRDAAYLQVFRCPAGHSVDLALLTAQGAPAGREPDLRHYREALVAASDPRAALVEAPDLASVAYRVDREADAILGPFAPGGTLADGVELLLDGPFLRRATISADADAVPAILDALFAHRIAGRLRELVLREGFAHLAARLDGRIHGTLTHLEVGDPAHPLAGLDAIRSLPALRTLVAAGTPLALSPLDGPELGRLELRSTERLEVDRLAGSTLPVLFELVLHGPLDPAGLQHLLAALRMVGLHTLELDLPEPDPALVEALASEPPPVQRLCLPVDAEGARRILAHAASFATVPRLEIDRLQLPDALVDALEQALPGVVARRL